MSVLLGLTVTGRRCKRLFGLRGSTPVLFHDGVLFDYLLEKI
ncbi:hypothetical protein HanXRQr2_Chr05g0219661 [Helianthus annuus]|uniref:Uncharacterized protein n=1 Tax=Helianthus annuus TaxID=4232 RepID=A0A9K3J0D5_HELAN|nr:hypothetical protein HanXRQr2_Chr05g0219661 [Helianthus annuus]